MKQKKIIVLCVLGLLVLLGIGIKVNAAEIFYRFMGSPTVYNVFGHGFATPQEFYNAGGDFNNVKIIGEESFGGVSAGSEYNSQTLLATTNVSYKFKNGRGTFGSVIINVLGTGNTVFYDATTTNVNLRAGATSSLPVIGVIAASQVAGVYTYDTVFNYGLIGVFSGTQGTTTLTWR